MKKGNKVIITLLITLLILVLIAGGAFAYIYFATDLLKTDKQLFFEYFSQISTEEEGKYSFFDNKINDFYEKKIKTPYENSGTITVDVEYPEELNVKEEIIGKVNDLIIRFSGNVDSTNQKVEQNIEVDYGNEVIFPINYTQDGNSFGLQMDELSKNFIAIRNDNLDELVGNITGEENLNEVISNIDYEKFQFTEEELNQLKTIYEPILNELLADENFSSLKLEQDESYTLELSNEKIKSLTIKLLETTKENTLIIDKINEIILEYDAETEKIDATIIDDILDSVNELDISNIPNLKITLVQNKKQLKQIIIQSGKIEFTIEKNITENDLSYDINWKVKVEDTDTSGILEESAEVIEGNVYLKLQYVGLNNLTDVNENYELGFSITAEEQTMEYDYKIDTNTKFVETVEVEEIDENGTVFLNDYDETQVTNFLTQVGAKLLQINKEQMAELGLEEYENPLLYSNPITMLAISNFNMASESIEDTSNLAYYQQQQFNERFSKYEGTNLSGADVNALITTVQNSNLSSSGQGGGIVKVTLDGAEIWEKVDSNQTYNVEAVYDENGLVSEMRVTTNN